MGKSPSPFLTTVFWPSHPPLSTLDFQPSVHKPNYLFLLLYSQFSSEWTSCHPSEPSIFSKMVMIWQQSWTAKSDYSWKYSDVILQTLIRDPPKGCKRLQITKAKAKSRFLALPTVPLLFYPCPHFPPLSHKHKHQQICCLVLLKKMGETLKFWHFWQITSA